MTPLRVGLVGGLLALVFVMARLLVAADGDVSRFVVAGSTFVDPATVEPAVHVFDSVGYDGQFYWRLAVDPAARSVDPAHGVELDLEIRSSRVGYPALAWVGSLGQPGLVVWSLVLVNVVGLGLVAAFGAAFSRDRGMPAIFGLLPAASTGLMMALARDLTEITMVACLLGGVLAVGRRQYGWATLGFVAAVVTHEQAVAVVAAYGIYRIVGWVRVRRLSVGAADAPWMGSGIAFLGVQGLMAVATGTVPVLGSGENNITLPLMDLVPGVLAWMTGNLEAQELLAIPQMALLLVTLVVAWVAARSLDAQDRWLLWALAGAAALSSVLGRVVWEGPAELRQVVLVPTFAWLVIIAARALPHRLLLASTGLVWGATAVLRVAVI